MTNSTSGRQQLPPQIKKIEVTDRSTSKPMVRYQMTVDAGYDLQTGRRRQVRDGSQRRRLHVSIWPPFRAKSLPGPTCS